MNHKDNYKSQAEVYSEKQEIDNQSSMIFENLIWMTSKEAALFLRLESSGALRTLVCRGKIKAKKWNGKLYFKRKELNNILENSPTVGGF